jgi:hypothetical protein
VFNFLSVQGQFNNLPIDEFGWAHHGIDGSLVPDAASYAPVTVLIDRRSDGGYLSYDEMASLLAPRGNAEAVEIAGDLDVKVRRMLQEAAFGK